MFSQAVQCNRFFGVNRWVSMTVFMKDSSIKCTLYLFLFHSVLFTSFAIPVKYHLLELEGSELALCWYVSRHDCLCLDNIDYRTFVVGLWWSVCVCHQPWTEDLFKRIVKQECSGELWVRLFLIDLCDTTVTVVTTAACALQSWIPRDISTFKQL